MHQQTGQDDTTRDSVWRALCHAGIEPVSPATANALAGAARRLLARELDATRAAIAEHNAPPRVMELRP